MAFIRTETTLQGTWNLAQLISAIKTAFSQLADTTLFDEYTDATKTYLVFKITFSANTYGSAYLRVQITNATFALTHSVATGWNATTHVVIGYESTNSASITLLNTEALHIQTFDSPTAKEGKIVSLTNQGSMRSFMMAVVNPQLYKDPDVSDTSKYFYPTNGEHSNNKIWNLPSHATISAYTGCALMVEQPNYIHKGNLSGNENRVITGISLFPSDSSNYITAVIFGIFTQDVGICFCNSVNAGSAIVTSNGTYYTVTKTATQTYCIRC